MSQSEKNVYLFQHPELKGMVDLDSICCACFSGENLLKLSKYKWKDATLLEIMKYCLPLQDLSNEWSPPNICSNCVGDLLHTYMFLRKASSAYIILKNKTTNKDEEDSDSINETAQEEQPVEEIFQEESPNNEVITFKDEKTYESDEDEAELFEQEPNLCMENEYQVFQEEDQDYEFTEGNELVEEESEKSLLLKEEIIAEESEIFDEEFNNVEINNEVVSSGESDSCQSLEGRVKEYKCAVCDFKFDRYRVYKQHVKKYHPQDIQFMCEVCGKFLTSKVGLKNHKTTHSEEKRFICEKCGKDMKTVDALRMHINNVHLGKPKPRKYLCPTCGKGFRKKFTLDHHIFTHTKEKPYSCNTCGMKFSLKCNLLRHNLLHEGIKPFACNICGKGYTQKNSLTGHIKNFHRPGGNQKKKKCRYCLLQIDDPQELTKHIEEIHKIEKESSRLKVPLKDLSCSICGKSYRCRAVLEEHITIHTGVKNFECHVCKKRFRLGLHLKQHMLIHSKEKPHECKECGMRFRQKSHLTYHKAIHEGVKNYVCPYCNKAFTLKGNLTVHIRIHTGETPYICKICKKGFNDSSGLKRHIKSQHTAENEINDETGEEAG